MNIKHEVTSLAVTWKTLALAYMHVFFSTEQRRNQRSEHPPTYFMRTSSSNTFKISYINSQSCDRLRPARTITYSHSPSFADCRYTLTCRYNRTRSRTFQVTRARYANSLSIGFGKNRWILSSFNFAFFSVKPLDSTHQLSIADFAIAIVIEYLRNKTH